MAAGSREWTLPAIAHGMSAISLVVEQCAFMKRKVIRLFSGNDMPPPWYEICVYVREPP
jgi:hypothetical protein